MSSTFVDAIGLALFKNIFWSSSFEHDGSYLPFPKKVLLNREIFIVTLSTGPVSLGNGINYTNVEPII